MRNLYLRQSIYYYRKSIPSYLKIYFNNKKLFIKTLQTTSKKLAIKYVILLNKKFEAIKEVYGMGIDKEVIYKLVDELHNTMLQETERDLFNIPNPEDTIFALSLEDIIKEYQKNYHNGIYEDNEIDIIAKKLGKGLNKGDRDEIGKILLESKINHLKVIFERIDSEYYKKSKPLSSSTMKIVQKVQANEQVQESREVVTIGQIREEYIKFQSKEDNWSKDTTQLALRAFNMLELFFADKDISEIKFKDLIEFRDTMQEIPNRLTSLNEFKDKDLDYILENNEGYDKLTNSTINKYIIKTNQFLKWAYMMEYIDKQDIAIPKLANDTKSRMPFTNEEIQEIKKQVARDDNKEIAMITYLAMYQGMRLKEITQLRKSDIVEIGGIKCISINKEDGKTTKTEKSVRTIPIHKKLIELGFNEYLGRSGEQLFSINNKDFSSYYMNNYKDLVNETKPFYSLRHSFINALYQNGDAKLEHIQALVGHTQGQSITFNYTMPLNVKKLGELLEMIDY